MNPGLSLEKILRAQGLSPAEAERSERSSRLPQSAGLRFEHPLTGVRAVIDLRIRPHSKQTDVMVSRDEDVTRDLELVRQFEEQGVQLLTVSRFLSLLQP